MKKIVCFFLFYICLASQAWAQADTLKGLVVGIADGDTFTLLTEQKTQYKIRLAEIDAPEKDQPFGMKSKQMLSDMIFKKAVLVVVQDIDRYGRTVGRIYTDTLDVNLAMVLNGGAWAYLHYLKDARILTAENKARQLKAGLWSLQADQIIPPWEWRHNKQLSN